MYTKLQHHGSLEIEVGEIGHTYQHQTIWSRLRSGFSTQTVSDTVESTLASRLSQHPSIKTLLHWYRRTVHLQQSTLVRDSLWLTKDDGSVCQFAEDETVSQCFVKVYEELNSGYASGLRICALSTSTSGMPKMYSFPYEVYLTLSGQVNDATRLFHLVTARLLTFFWADNVFEEQIIDVLVTGSSLEPPQWQPRLPSRSNRLPTRPLAPTEMIQQSSKIDKSNWADLFYLELQWTAQLPHYDNDMDVYVWEPFKQRPSHDFVRLLALEQTSPGERRLVAVASSSRLLARLSLEPIRPDRRLALLPDVNTQLFRFLASIYRIICADVTQFITQASARVVDIDMRSRSNASGWKIKLLLHLQECYRHAAQRCDENVQTVEMLISCMHLPCLSEDVALYDYAQELGDCKLDLEYLATELRVKADAIDAVKKLVREQMDLDQNYKNAVIAVLVALYVPISFVSSFLGMNITDHSSAHYWQNISGEVVPKEMNFTRRSPPKSPTNNYTSNLIYTSNTGPRTWELTSFWASAFPLAVVTIVVPLVVGPLFRWLVQFARRHAVWWRVVVMFLTISFVVAINVIGIGSYFTWKKENALEESGEWYSKEGQKELRKLDKEGTSFYLVQFSLAMLEFAMLFMLCAWHFHVARKLRLRWPMPLFWTLVFLLNGLSFCQSEPFELLTWYIENWAGYETISIIIPLLPWIIMFLFWIIRPVYFYTIGEYKRQLRLRKALSDAQPVRVK